MRQIALTPQSTPQQYDSHLYKNLPGAKLNGFVCLLVSCILG